MKKITILFVLLFVVSIGCKAQTISYTPFIPGQTSSTYQTPDYTPHTTSQTARVTAYYQDTYTKEYYKVPVKVIIISTGYSTQIKLIEKYLSYGFEGNWEKVYNSGNAQKCSPIMGGLEEYFMYKVFADGKHYYFDL